VKERKLKCEQTAVWVGVIKKNCKDEKLVIKIKNVE